jgi:histone H3/H4
MPPLKPIGGGGVVKEKKKRAHRFRPGERAKIEVRQQQRSMKKAVPPACFVRIVREIMHDISAEKGEPWLISANLFHALAEESERFVAQLFECSSLLCMARGRKTLMPADIRNALRVSRHMGDYSKIVST